MTDLPKLPPDAVARRGVEAWLERNAARRVRIVAGQPGCGKTVAVAAWARGRANAARWITIAPGATESALRDLVPESPCGELVIDGGDRASAGGRAFLARLAHDAPAGSRFVFLVRDARPFAAAASARDTAHADVAALRFDDAEIEGFCAAHGVASTAKERRHLVAATGGWAFAVAGTVRYAAALGGTLAAAFPRWLATARPFIAQLIDDAAADAPAAAAAFDRVARGVAGGTDDLRDASHAAFFVDRAGESYCVNPVVASLRGNGRESARPAPAVLHMFGRFRVTIGSGEVCFGRRRARSLIQYLAVRGDGTATRDELLREFWPGMERRAAAGALVNTCSTIRRALAQCVGGKPSTTTSPSTATRSRCASATWSAPRSASARTSTLRRRHTTAAISTPPSRTGRRRCACTRRRCCQANRRRPGSLPRSASTTKPRATRRCTCAWRRRR